MKKITLIGSLVALDPARAHARLVREFEKWGTRNAVAANLSVEPSTLHRWIERLEAAGYSDPRLEARRRGASRVRPPIGKKSAGRG